MTPKVQCCNCAFFQPAKDYPRGRLGDCEVWKTKHYPERLRSCQHYKERKEEESE